jgi:hypothetical protein
MVIDQVTTSDVNHREFRVSVKYYTLINFKPYSVHLEFFS